jgi:hypothetical protein
MVLLRRTGTSPRWRRRRAARHARTLTALLGMCAIVTFVSACGGSSAAAGDSIQSQRAALSSYLHAVEPIRLAVNRLLEGADPILSAFNDGRISPAAAARRMGALERRFAAYTVAIAAVEARGSHLGSLQALYAHTYILEDSYLSALTNGLSERELDDLPNTQAEQRAAIIQWRTGLTVIAQRLGVTLPGDLQQAGRGEIAPSPSGS